MNNESFRIKNYEGEYATVFPIGVGDFFTVVWDASAPDATVYSKQQVEDAIASGYMVKIETQPRHFKFYCVSEPNCIYTYTLHSFGNPVVSWDGDGKNYTDSYTVEDVRDNIAEGRWIVIPSEPENKADISSLQLKIVVDNSKANEMIAETTALAEKLQASLLELKKAMGEDDFVKIDFEGIL